MSEDSFKSLFIKVCARERFRIERQKPFFWVRVRMQMVRYYEENYGVAPKILKARRIPMDPFMPGMNGEFRKWLNK